MRCLWQDRVGHWQARESVKFSREFCHLVLESYKLLTGTELTPSSGAGTKLTRCTILTSTILASGNIGLLPPAPLSPRLARKLIAV